MKYRYTNVYTIFTTNLCKNKLNEFILFLGIEVITAYKYRHFKVFKLV